MLKYKSLKVVVLTVLDDSESVRNALMNGADGYISKDIKPEDLRQAIKNCVNGVSVIGNDLMYRFVREYGEMLRAQGSRARKGNMELLDREKEIIRFIILGKDTKEIATALFLSEGRTRNIISNMLKKFNLKDRTQLAIFALKKKLI